MNTNDASGYNDDYYNRTHGFLYEVCSDLKHDEGEAPSVNNILELLRSAFNDLPDGLLSDMHGKEMVALAPKWKKKSRIKLRVGDLIHVPIGTNRSILSIYLGANRVGDAFGCFTPEFINKLEAMKIAPARLRPLLCCYIDPELVEKGSWSIIGNNQDLLSLFPRDPEVYHNKKHHPQDQAIGEFGAAESADSKTLRNIEKNEAERVGLLDGSYESTFFPDGFIHYINLRLAGDPKGSGENGA